MSAAPTPTNPAAERLRARAAVLRDLARRLQHLRALDLGRIGGPDTWVGPSPQRCHDAMRAARTALLDRVDDVLRTAHRFEREADKVAAVPIATGRA